MKPAAPVSMMVILGFLCFLVLSILVALVWLAVVYTTRYVSLGSVIAGFLTPILAAAFGYPLEYLLFTVLAATLVIVRHRENIERLLHGTENKI